MKIGLIGEAPFDTVALENLLSQKYFDNIEYVTLLKDVTGSNLDNAKMIKFARRQYEKHKPNFIIYFRDLDALKSDREKILYRKEWFNKMNSMLDKKCILLLFIFEIEALLFADIETTNNFYNTNVVDNRIPEEIHNAKEEAYKLFKINGVDIELFSKFNLQNLENNYSILKEFFIQFEQKLNTN